MLKTFETKKPNSVHRSKQQHADEPMLRHRQRLKKIKLAPSDASAVFRLFIIQETSKVEIVMSDHQRYWKSESDNKS